MRENEVELFSVADGWITDPAMDLYNMIKSETGLKYCKDKSYWASRSLPALAEDGRQTGGRHHYFQDM
jgi:hypothetical protein